MPPHRSRPAILLLGLSRWGVQQLQEDVHGYSGGRRHPGVGSRRGTLAVSPAVLRLVGGVAAAPGLADDERLLLGHGLLTVRDGREYAPAHRTCVGPAERGALSVLGQRRRATRSLVGVEVLL